MAAIVVPFRGATGKRRLEQVPAHIRRELALAMLADVLAAATVVGRTIVATPDPDGQALAEEFGAAVVEDHTRGQGAAVARALRTLPRGRVLVVNSDLPSVLPRDLRSLAAAVPAGGVALVEAADGTTNALGLARPRLFIPLYGPESASRFRAHAEGLGVDFVSASIASLHDDVDELADLERLGLRAGPRTLAVAESLTTVSA